MTYIHRQVMSCIITQKNIATPSERCGAT